MHSLTGEEVSMQTSANPGLCAGSAINTSFGQVPATFCASVSSSVKGACQSLLEENLMKLKDVNISGLPATLLITE